MTIQIFKGVQNQELALKADYDKLAASFSTLMEQLAITNDAVNRETKLANQYRDKCDKLVAENQFLKESYEDDIGAYSATIHVPNTSSAIAEFKAQGVDLSANELKALAERSRAEAPVAAEHIHSAALYLMTIAAELRAGGEVMTNKTQIAELRKICEILNDYGYDPDWKGGGVGVHNAAKTIQIIIKQHCESSKMLEAAEARIAGIEKNLDAGLYREKRVERQLLAKEAELAAIRGDAEPVAWTDDQELRDLAKHGCAYLFKADPVSPHADPRRVIKLFTHAQPVPVVVLPKPFHPSYADIAVKTRDEQWYQALEAAGITVKSADGEGA
ncbi:hypothetical protein [Rouxiella badensis]|uniref:hypothetical protein n=1 Tax=Rouxiella badensis TaxID=1646377 RepID=UPI003C3C0C59